jgi:hypothetical protein
MDIKMNALTTAAVMGTTIVVLKNRSRIMISRFKSVSVVSTKSFPALQNRKKLR